MPIRLKKLIGTVLLIALVVVYALLATMIAVAQLSQSGPLVAPCLLPVQRAFVDLAGDGHHQMDDGGKAARLTAHTVTSTLPALASGVVMPDSMVFR